MRHEHPSISDLLCRSVTSVKRPVATICTFQPLPTAHDEVESHIKHRHTPLVKELLKAVLVSSPIVLDGDWCSGGRENRSNSSSVPFKSDGCSDGSTFSTVSRNPECHARGGIYPKVTTAAPVPTDQSPMQKALSTGKGFPCVGARKSKSKNRLRISQDP